MKGNMIDRIVHRPKVKVLSYKEYDQTWLNYQYEIEFVITAVRKTKPIR